VQKKGPLFKRASGVIGEQLPVHIRQSQQPAHTKAMTPTTDVTIANIQRTP
jgi:hypothetical protein